MAKIQAEYTQSLYKQTLGLDIKIDEQIFKQRIAKMNKGDFDMVLAGWGPDYDDGLTFGDLFASWNLNNRGRYTSEEYDRNVAIAQNSIDQAVRAKAFAELQRLIYEDVVILPNYERGPEFCRAPDAQRYGASRRRWRPRLALRVHRP